VRKGLVRTRIERQDFETRNLKEFAIHMKFSFVLAGSLGFTLALGASAQTLPLPSAPSAPGTSAPPAPAGPAKIAIVAFKLAVAQTNEGQRDFADLQKKFMPKEQQLKALNDEIESLTRQVQAGGDKLTAADRAAKLKSIDEKKKRLDRDAQDARADFQQQIGDMYNQLASKVFDVMAEYVEKAGYTMVLDTSDQQTPVLYYNPATEISKAVIDAYNVKSGVPAPPPTTSSPAAVKPSASSAPKAPVKTTPAAH
jgi:Skp family chaperone for outer membrane proteins